MATEATQVDSNYVTYNLFILKSFIEQVCSTKWTFLSRVTMITKYVCNDQAQELKLSLQSLISIGLQKCKVKKSQQIIVFKEMWFFPGPRKVCSLQNIWSYIFT